MTHEIRKTMAGYHLRILDLTKRDGREPGYITVIPLRQEQYERIIAAQGADTFSAGCENSLLCSVHLPSCFDCGRETKIIDPHTGFCPHCLEKFCRKCPDCGKHYLREDRFCRACVECVGYGRL